MACTPTKTTTIAAAARRTSNPLGRPPDPAGPTPFGDTPKAPFTGVAAELVIRLTLGTGQTSGHHPLQAIPFMPPLAHSASCRRCQPHTVEKAGHDGVLSPSSVQRGRRHPLRVRAGPVRTAGRCLADGLRPSQTTPGSTPADEIVADSCHRAWASYLHELWAGDPAQVRCVLDLGCGTGLMAAALTAYGYRVTGASVGGDVGTCPSTPRPRGRARPTRAARPGG